VSGSVKGAILLLILGIIVIVATYFLLPILKDEIEKNTSDAGASKGTITIGMDNFAGYFPLCSPFLKKEMLKEGYLIKCVDDKADYDGRMKNLKEGNLDFAVATVDSYTLNGARHSFPGVVVAVIDESKGGDAIVAYKDEIPNIDALKTGDIKIAFTPDSPSAHLLKTVATNFDIPALKKRNGKWRLESDGSEQALKNFIQKSAKAAVLWEPDVSKALGIEGTVNLMSTKDTDKLIVDILLANRSYSKDKENIVKLLLSNYFKTLKQYKKNKKALIADMKKYSGVSEKQIKPMLQGISWVSLYANARKWFGVSVSGQKSDFAIYDTIESTIKIQIDYGDFKKSPLPDEDPRRVVFSKPVEELYKNGILPEKENINLTSSLEKDFEPLDEGGWKNLREVGTLRTRPIYFSRGTDRLTMDGKEEIDHIIESLKRYPNFRIVIEGHTNPRGDEKENRNLSFKRASSVGRYLNIAKNVDSDRIKTVGSGSKKPLEKREDESDREYMDRLSRVEIRLVTEEY